MFQNQHERRRVKGIFNKMVDPEVVDSILQDGEKGLTLKQARVEFILVFVRDDVPSEVSERMGAVMDTAKAARATIHDVIGALVVMAFGTHPALGTNDGSRASLVDALRSKLGADIKIVHGAADGQCGLFGSERGIMTHSFLVPHFDKILGSLSRLKFGEIEEFRQ